MEQIYDRKSNFLKKLLTTISLLTVITSNSTSMAENIQNMNDHDATLANGDDFQFSSANALTTDVEVTTNTINLNNNAAGTFTVTHDICLASSVTLITLTGEDFIVSEGDVDIMGDLELL